MTQITSVLKWDREALFGHGRIPSIDYHNGTLFIATGCRTLGYGDLPSGSKVGFLKSTDNGQTFTALKHIMDIGGTTTTSGVDDPCIVVNKQTGRIFVFATTAINGNPWFVKCPLNYVYSDDLGETWSTIQTLTIQNNTYQDILVVSCGNGIYIDEKGWIVVPLYGKQTSSNAESGTFVYSDNNGVTWKQGGRIGDGVDYIGEHRIIYSQGQFISIGRTSNGQYRSDWRSSDGVTWTASAVNKKLLNNIGINPGLMNFTYNGKEYWLCSSSDMTNSHQNSSRRYGRVLISENRGMSWQPLYQVTTAYNLSKNFFAYSCLVVSNTSLFVLYETESYQELKLLKIDFSEFL